MNLDEFGGLLEQFLYMICFTRVLLMSEEDKPGEISLEVAEINKASVGRGLCSAGTHVARRLKLKAGEIVEITGKRTTAGICFPNTEDEGKQIIHVDDLVRFNAGTSFGEFVKVRKARPIPAKRVVVALTNTEAQIPPSKIRDSLMNRPVVKGDNLSLMNMAIPTDQTGIEFPRAWQFEYGNSWKQATTLGELRLVVLETTPEKGIAQITQKTTFEIKESPNPRK
jgi:transitional endoplasmic reticulum ATPase